MQYIILILASRNHDNFSQKFVILRVFVTRGPEIWFVIMKFVIPRVRYTERIYMQFTRIQETGHLVRNGGGSLLQGGFCFSEILL